MNLAFSRIGARASQADLTFVTLDKQFILSKGLGKSDSYRADTGILKSLKSSVHKPGLDG